MHPEDDPADEQQNFPCPVCDGYVTERDGVWSCSKCDFEAEAV